MADENTATTTEVTKPGVADLQASVEYLTEALRKEHDEHNANKA